MINLPHSYSLLGEGEGEREREGEREGEREEEREGERERESLKSKVLFSLRMFRDSCSQLLKNFAEGPNFFFSAALNLPP